GLQQSCSVHSPHADAVSHSRSSLPTSLDAASLLITSVGRSLDTARHSPNGLPHSPSEIAFQPSSTNGLTSGAELLVGSFSSLVSGCELGVVTFSPSDFDSCVGIAGSNSTLEAGSSAESTD